MTRAPSKATNVRSWGHDAGTGTLEVEVVDGKVFQYDGVPRHVADAITAAGGDGPKVRSLFLTLVKGKYPCRKVEL